MSKEVTTVSTTTRIEQVLIQGDLTGLNDGERLSYYKNVCETVGLNPLTRPFDYLKLSGKLVLYATKGCAEQLRNIHKISIKPVAREKIDDCYVVTLEASNAEGRVDSSTGAICIAGLKGDALANAMMKAETKAKRRVTLSICGLNMLDDTEVETIPGARQAEQPPAAPHVQKNTPPPTGPVIRTKKVAEQEIFVAGEKLGIGKKGMISWAETVCKKTAAKMTLDDMDMFLEIVQDELNRKEITS